MKFAVTPSCAFGPIHTLNLPASAAHLLSAVQNAKSFDVIKNIAVVLSPPFKVTLLNPFNYLRGLEYDPNRSLTKKSTVSSAVTVPVFLIVALTINASPKAMESRLRLILEYVNFE